MLILRVFLTCVENKKELKKCQVLPSIKKDLSEKIVELLQYNKLLTEFIFYLSEINYLSWFVQGEQHSVNWSNQAFHIEFILRIKECFGDNILPINMKKTFLKMLVWKNKNFFLIGIMLVFGKNLVILKGVSFFHLCREYEKCFFQRVRDNKALIKPW